MATSLPSESELKDALKAALVEVLEERADLLRDVLAEVVEDVAFARAIQEGETTGPASRKHVFRVSRERYEAALAAVPDVEPEERDRL